MSSSAILTLCLTLDVVSHKLTTVNPNKDKTACNKIAIGTVSLCIEYAMKMHKLKPGIFMKHQNHVWNKEVHIHKIKITKLSVG